MQTEWSPWFDWTMDLVKFGITFGVSALITVLIIDNIQERRSEARNRRDAIFQLQMISLSEFRQAVTAYEVAALSAYTDIYQWKGGEKTAAMQRYESNAYSDFLAAADGLAHRFKDDPKIVTLVEELRAAHKNRHKIYDRLIDQQLDRGPGLNMWDYAEERRPDFDKLLTDAADLRQRIIASAESDIVGEQVSKQRRSERAAATG